MSDSSDVWQHNGQVRIHGVIFFRGQLTCKAIFDVYSNIT